MATATVIHFGTDDCLRVPALRSAGYEVLVSDTLEELKLSLDHGEGVDAVIVSGSQPCCIEKAAALVRQHSSAPLILFRQPDAKHNESRFDRVYSGQVAEAQWLFETAVLVMQCKELRAQAEHLRKQSERVLRETSEVQAESRRKLEQAAELKRKLPLSWPLPD